MIHHNSKAFELSLICADWPPTFSISNELRVMIHESWFITTLIFFWPMTLSLSYLIPWHRSNLDVSNHVGCYSQQRTSFTPSVTLPKPPSLRSVGFDKLASMGEHPSMENFTSYAAAAHQCDKARQRCDMQYPPNIKVNRKHSFQLLVVVLYTCSVSYHGQPSPFWGH